MFDALRYFPAALQAGIVLYGLASFLWLQPLFEQRYTAKVILPQCEAKLSAIAIAEQRKIERERRARDNLLETYRRAMEPLSQMPGMDVLDDLLAHGDIESISPPSGVDALGRCGCGAGKVLDQHWLPVLLHVMSARTYTPSVMATFLPAATDIAASDECGSEGSS